MPTQKKRGPARKPTLKSNSVQRQHSAKPLEPPREGDSFKVWCDGCQSEATFDFRRREWFFSAFTRRCPKGRDCQRNLAEQGGCQPWQLKADPRPYFAESATTARRHARPPQPVPTRRELVALRRAARRGDPLRYLMTERGLDRDTIATHGIGYGRVVGRVPGFVLPVYGEADPLFDDSPRRPLIQVMIRHWPKPWVLVTPDKRRERRLSVLRGRTAALYPDVPDGPVILCEGGFDALLGRQHGLPTVTTTCGAQLPEPLAARFARMDVTVIYDAGTNTALTVERLRAAGAGHVHVVDLAAEGLADGEDVTDWFMKYEHTVAELRDLIRRSKAGG